MLEFTYAQVQCDAAQWRLALRLRSHFKLVMRLLDMEVANVESLLTQLVALRDNWKAMWNEAELVASSLQSEVNCLGSVVPLRYKERDSMMRMHPGAELGGCQGGPLPPKILPGPPSGPPKIFQVFF